MPESQSAQDKIATVSLPNLMGMMRNASSKDLELIKKAYLFAERAHESHFRNSGEPYLNHLFETARILAELGTGSSTIAAGLLHDSMEDVGVKREEITKEFGEEVAFLVEGVTKLGHLKYKGADRHNESLRKLFVAMSEDIRVLLIKLADRLHNMRTLGFVPKEKQNRIAAETLEIYAPVAYRLGIRRLSRELENLAFPYVYPKEYEEIKKMLKERRLDKAESLEKFSRSVKKALAKEGMTKAKTEYRIKSLYSLYHKFLRHDKDMEKIYDVNAMRILVGSVSDCYKVLGIIHEHWRPLPRRIKDYIAFPKPNGYQALHTTVFIGDGNIVEVQIKTEEMYRYSEYGIASHFTYKSPRSEREILAWIYALLPRKTSMEKKNAPVPVLQDTPKWIKELAEYHEPSSDYKLFRERLSSDFFNERIFVFSPKGDVVDLPVDSTPVDFAYSIHSDVGNHMTGAKVNGKLVSLETPLKNGDIVFITTNDSAKPHHKWLEMAKTGLAKRHIKNRLNDLGKPKNS